MYKVGGLRVALVMVAGSMSMDAMVVNHLAGVAVARVKCSFDRVLDFSSRLVASPMSRVWLELDSRRT